jgi:CheY-like chemotaxis protein
MKRRILLADDSVTIQKVIELTFMDEDYEVRAVSNGDEALALLPEVKPEFVIADVHMPGANGYEVCRRSKQLRPDVPVLLLVGTFEPFDENEARACGADSFLKKPFDSQELLQRVQELLAPKAAATPPPLPPELPTLEFPPVAGLAPPPVPAFAFDEQPPAPAFAPEPSWGSFDLEPTPPAFSPAPPAPPVLTPEPFAAPEPFDHEPAFALEPDPTYQVEQEPVFELEESTTSFAVQGDVFGAPSELSFDEPQDRYLPEEPTPAPAPAVAAAGFDWSAPAPELELEPEPLPWVAPEPEPVYAAAPAATPEPEPEPELAAAPVAGNGHLSDADVDRIARRVVELLGDKTVRDVAWEVIPDMAEVIIRDRLRELEAQVE